MAENPSSSLKYDFMISLSKLRNRISSIPHAGVALLFVMSFLFLFVLRINVISYYIADYNVDEYHTIHQGLNFLVNGEVENFRVQEGTRWLVRLFYPVALINMNTHMGGNVFLDDWDYPGHNYVVKNFVNDYDTFLSNLTDTNLRDLFYSLRTQYALLVYVSFLPLLWYLFRKKYYISAFGLIILLGVNAELLKEQSIFYVEPALLACVNLIMYMYFRFNASQKITSTAVMAYAVLLGFAISVKFTAVPLMLIPLVQILWINREIKKRIFHTALFLGTSFLSYVLINFPAMLSRLQFNRFLHDFTSNFWQYAAGSSAEYTVAAGASHFALILSQLEGLFGFALYAVPIVLLFGLYYGSKEQRRLLFLLTFLTVFVMMSFLSQRVYIVRNLIPFYSIFTLAFLFSLDILWKHFGDTQKMRISYVLVALLSLSGIVRHNDGFVYMSTVVFPNARHSAVLAVNELVKKSDTRSIYSVGWKSETYKDIIWGGRVISVSNAPSNLHSGNYADFESDFAGLPNNSIVLVRRVANNNHLSNYVLPKYFYQNKQFGDYYVFYNN